MNLENLCATAIHPLFKKKGVSILFPEVDFNTIQYEILRQMENETELAQPEEKNEPNETSRSQTFFNVSLSSSIELSSSDASNLLILEQFFVDPNISLSIFDNPKYVKLRNIFILLNTKIPSSASVERLFSIAKKFWTYDRPNLGDKVLEQMIFLKYNSAVL